MLDKLPAELWEDQSKTFLDNSCGNGNFLVAVLRRKLAKGHDSRQALATIFGVDLMPDNVEECRHRLLELIEDTPDGVDPVHYAIVEQNIVCHDALTYDYSFGRKAKFEFGL